MAFKYKSGSGNEYWRVTINRKGHKIDKLFPIGAYKSAKDFEILIRQSIDNGTYIDETSKQLLIPTVKTLLEDFYNLTKDNGKEFVAYNLNVKDRKFKLIQQLPNIKITLPDSNVYYGNYKTFNKYDLENDEIPLGEFYIDCIDEYIISRYIVIRREKGLKDGSISAELAKLKSAFKTVNKLYPHLKSEGIVINNPFLTMSRNDLPKRSPARKTIVNLDFQKKAKEFFSKKKNKQYLICYLICLNCGTRKTETLSIKFEHINRKEKTIFIPMTKNTKPRTIVTNDEILELLPEKENGNVFTLSQSAINMEWSRCFKDLPKESRPVFHTLKNTAISNAVSQQDKSSFVLAEKFNISIDLLKQFLMSAEAEKVISKLKSGGQGLTDEEISKFVGGHSSLKMTQHYFTDKKQ